MKTERELNEDILKITQEIHDEFPELSKYIGEMPIKNLRIDNISGNIESLENYCNSLIELLKTYSGSHKNRGEDKTANKKYFTGDISGDD